jgi:hypothetical protein
MLHLSIVRTYDPQTNGRDEASLDMGQQFAAMTTQFDDVVEDVKRSAKEGIAEYLKRQNGSSTVIDKLIRP